MTAKHSPISNQELGIYLDKEQQKDTRTVSLFGTSLPARSLLGWGAWILVAVQLYLLLHLKDSASLRTTTEETRFPWIGVYRDPLARLVFLASITAVPVAAMVALGARLITLSGAESLVATINFWQLSAAAVVSGALAILTFRSARLAS